MALKLGKIFGMFDKIDDIVYEPVKLFCDALRQPLNQLNLSNDKKIAEHSQQLKMELEQFEIDLELERKEREMRLTMEEQKIQEEINDMICKNDIANREQMIQLEMQYRQEMSTAAVKLANVIVTMETDARGKLMSLYAEKIKEYKNLQEEHLKDVQEAYKNLRELFPNSSDDTLIMQEILTQMRTIHEDKREFEKNLINDMNKVLGIIDDSVKEVTGLAAKYFQPAQPNQKALTQNVVDAIEG